MIKVELHAHTSDDPEDVIRHSARNLVDRAVALGYGGLAITLHDRYFRDDRLAGYAAERGLTLIPSIERTIERCHVLLINVDAEVECVGSFEALREYKRRRPDSLVVAPHPWFPLGRSLGGASVERHADLWDAVEINAFYTTTIDFNRRARQWASDHRVPLVGNCDVHQLHQLGSTFSLVNVRGGASAENICAAIREGRVRVESRPITHARAAVIVLRALWSKRSRPRSARQESH